VSAQRGVLTEEAGCKENSTEYFMKLVHFAQ
jgi:hypothetical protein